MGSRRRGRGQAPGAARFGMPAVFQSERWAVGRSVPGTSGHSSLLSDAAKPTPRTGSRLCAGPAPTRACVLPVTAGVWSRSNQPRSVRPREAESPSKVATTGRFFQRRHCFSCSRPWIQVSQFGRRRSRACCFRRSQPWASPRARAGVLPPGPTGPAGNLFPGQRLLRGAAREAIQPGRPRRKRTASMRTRRRPSRRVPAFKSRCCGGQLAGGQDQSLRRLRGPGTAAVPGPRSRRRAVGFAYRQVERGWPPKPRTPGARPSRAQDPRTEPVSSREAAQEGQTAHGAWSPARAAHKGR